MLKDSKTAKYTMQGLREMFEVVRLVDPESTRVLEPDADGILHQTDKHCYDLWGRERCCRKCSSLKAMKNRSWSSKLESRDGKIFFVLSKYLAVGDGGCVLELASQIDFDLSGDDEGKSGGAFCAGYYEKNISRVMTNFAGSASDVSTLAHELGHAFNNRMLRHKPLMMNDTPMPLAETASTFNETLLIAQLLKDATPEEELTLLDSCLVEQTQTMVDIYSRFLFEQKVVAAQADHALDVDELKETMLWAQDQSYGDGLDPAFRHPYMWACTSHYYSPNVHFYNFPYAFGGLFARGLYARYEQEGEAFVPVYCDLLSRFGSDTIANVTASVGIDVTTPDFWRSAVESVLVQVRRFVELANQETAAK